MEVGKRLRRYCVVSAASPQKEGGSFASASNVWNSILDGANIVFGFACLGMGIGCSHFHCNASAKEVLGEGTLGEFLSSVESN